MAVSTIKQKGAIYNAQHDVSSYADMLFTSPQGVVLRLRPQALNGKNILQIYVNNLDYGYITFDVSRNVGSIQ